MKTTYLDNEILLLEGYKKEDTASPYQLRKLAEYREIKQLIIGGVSSSLPDLAECNQASLNYATKKDNPDFFLIKQTFKEGINWALNYMTKQK